MAQYRRTLSKDEQRYLHSEFKGHIKKRGGIFTPKTRRRLLGVRGEKNNEEGKPDTPDFWQDIRDGAKVALEDLRLLAWVADSDQLKEVFSVRHNFKDWDKENQQWKRPDPLAYINRLLHGMNPDEWRTDYALALVALSIHSRASYSGKIQNKLITDAFENAKAAAELALPSSYTPEYFDKLDIAAAPTAPEKMSEGAK